MTTDNNKPIAERLRRLDVCAVSDALDRLGLKGAIAELRPQAAARRIAGPVVTVLLGPAGATPAKRHLCAGAIEAAQQGDIIVVDNQGRMDAAGWGGLLTQAAVIRGVAGTIVDGAARDVDESLALDYPVYARTAVPFTARGRVAEVDWNMPIHIGGIDVRPGDLAIADGSGVAFISQDQAEDVIRAAEEIAAKEAAMGEAIRAGTPVGDVMGGAYETMLGARKRS